LSNEEKTNDYENFEKRGEEETKSMPHAPVVPIIIHLQFGFSLFISFREDDL
jgi:hypothetical protein